MASGSSFKWSEHLTQHQVSKQIKHRFSRNKIVHFNFASSQLSYLIKMWRGGSHAQSNRQWQYWLPDLWISDYSIVAYATRIIHEFENTCDPFAIICFFDQQCIGNPPKSTQKRARLTLRWDRWARDVCSCSCNLALVLDAAPVQSPWPQSISSGEIDILLWTWRSLSSLWSVAFLLRLWHLLAASKTTEERKKKKCARLHHV